MSGWIGVDLDGTLARYDGWQGPLHIGEPIPRMVGQVQHWLYLGHEVRVLTARVSVPEEAAAAERAIRAWCLEHIGQELPVTCRKDYGMWFLVDDRAVGVKPNTGRLYPTDLRLP